MSSLSVTVVMNFATLIMTFNFSINSADLQFYFMVCSARCKKKLDNFIGGFSRYI